MTRREPMGVEPHSSRARRDAPYRRTASHGAQTENNKRQQTIRIKDMRQGAAHAGADTGAGRDGNLPRFVS